MNEQSAFSLLLFNVHLCVVCGYFCATTELSVLWQMQLARMFTIWPLFENLPTPILGYSDQKTLYGSWRIFCASRNRIKFKLGYWLLSALSSVCFFQFSIMFYCFFLYLIIFMPWLLHIKNFNKTVDQYFLGTSIL